MDRIDGGAEQDHFHDNGANDAQVFVDNNGRATSRNDLPFLDREHDNVQLVCTVRRCVQVALLCATRPP